jgi:DNA polymerase-1
MATYLLLDVSALAYRSFWTTGHLSHGGDVTGTIYGFLRTLPFLQSYMNTPHLVFCFDFGKSMREKAVKSYKANRRKKEKELTDEQKDALMAMRNQVKLLRKKYLYEIGFRNIFYHKGYEGDDIIASVVKNTLRPEDDAIIISSDKDFWQLLDGKRIWMYDPKEKKVMTEDKLRQEWGVEPREWVMVKAIAGCKTDNVPKVKGVGDKTACAYIKDKCTERIRELIESHQELIESNLRLVDLPYEGVKTFTFKQDSITRESWRNVVKGLGMQSLVKTPPIFRRTLV